MSRHSRPRGTRGWEDIQALSRSWKRSFAKAGRARARQEDRRLTQTQFEEWADEEHEAYLEEYEAWAEERARQENEDAQDRWA